MKEDVKVEEVRRVAFVMSKPIVFERREGGNFLTTVSIAVGDRATVLGRVTAFELLLVKLDRAPDKKMVTADYCVRDLDVLERLSEALDEEVS